MDNTGVELALSLESYGSSLEEGFDLLATADKVVNKVRSTGKSVKEVSVAQESVHFLQVLVGVNNNYDFATMNREDIISDPEYGYKLCLEEGEGILSSIWGGIKAVWNAIWGTITKAIKWVLGLFGMKFEDAEEASKGVKEAGKETVNKVVEDMSSEEIVKNGLTFQMTLFGQTAGKDKESDKYIQTFADLQNTMDIAKAYTEAMIKAHDATGDGGLPRFETREATLNFIVDAGGKNHNKNKVVTLEEGLKNIKSTIATLINANLDEEMNKKLTENIHRQLKYDTLKKEMIEKENMPEGAVDKNIRMMAGGTDCYGLTRVYLLFSAKKIAESKDGNIKSYFVPHINVATVKIQDVVGSDKWNEITKTIAEKGSFNGKAYDWMEKAASKNAEYIKGMKSYAKHVEDINSFINRFIADAEKNGFTPEQVKEIMALAKAGNELFIHVNNGAIKILNGTGEIVAETTDDKTKKHAVNKDIKIGSGGSFTKAKGINIKDVKVNDGGANAGGSGRATNASDIK